MKRQLNLKHLAAAKGGRSNMASKKKQTTDTPSTAQTAPEEGQEVNLDELTTEQAFGILTNAVRQQAFTYVEHVQLEQARVAVAQAVQEN